jgi:hypothetical protein
MALELSRSLTEMSTRYIDRTKARWQVIQEYWRIEEEAGNREWSTASGFKIGDRNKCLRYQKEK